MGRPRSREIPWGQGREVDGGWSYQVCATCCLAAFDLFPTTLSIAYYSPAPLAFMLFLDHSRLCLRTLELATISSWIIHPQYLCEYSLPPSLQVLIWISPSQRNASCLSPPPPQLSLFPSVVPPEHLSPFDMLYSLFFIIVCLPSQNRHSVRVVICVHCSLLDPSLLEYCGAHSSLSMNICGMDECCSL